MHNNREIRTAAKAKKVHHWEIAERLGMLDSNFSRELRHELANDRKRMILDIIDELAAKKANKRTED